MTASGRKDQDAINEQEKATYCNSHCISIMHHYGGGCLLYVCDIATTWTSNQLASYASENSGIKVPGYSHLYFPADSEKVPITLWNPEGNECLFRFTLTLEEENDILYTSDFIEPGMALEEITLNHSLSPGDYRLLIQIEPYTMDKTTPLNRANVTADLTVQ